MENEQAYHIYRLLGLRGLGPVQVNRLLDRLAEVGADITHLSKDTSGFDELRKWLNDSQMERVMTHDVSLHDQIRQLGEKGARFISGLSPEYPRALSTTLQNSKPPMLSCMGNLQLLDVPSVGFCGSRRASEKGLEVARDCVEQLVAHQIPVVSGYASGVDQQVHLSALKSGGSTIVVLPEGLLNFQIRTVLRDVWDWTRVLVLSEFLPRDVWRASRAMQRNKTIISLSNAMVVIEAGEKGGTIDAGRTTLRLRRALYVVVYDNVVESSAGNRHLLELGAIPLLKNRETGKPNLAHLIESITGNRRSDVGSPTQLPLLWGR